ncbi:MAG: cytochrome c oxidase subunit II [Phycisphaeraceae bacterium]
MTKPMVLTAILGGTPATALAQTESKYFMPPGASNHAEHIDFAMHFINAVTVFFFVLIIALMLWFAFKYRRRSPNDRAGSQSSHNTALELSWSLPPAIIVIFMFYLGFQGFQKFNTPPGDAYEISVSARTWSWTFTHPNGFQSPHLHVPEGENVRLVMNSSDVIHSLYIPTFRIKRDVVPGRYTNLWFRALGTTPGADEPLPEGEELDAIVRADLRDRITTERERAQQQAEQAEAEAAEAAENGEAPQPEAEPEAEQEPQLPLEEEVERRLAEMDESEKLDVAIRERMIALEDDGHILYCTEYCGTNHSEMMARVVVHPAGWEPPDFARPDDPIEWGEQLFRTRGCAGCHQLPDADPTGVAAPSFAEGVYNKEHEMADGTVLTTDRNYLRRSILDPMADVRAGYPPAMPPGLVTDEDEIDAIIQYLTTLP